MDSIPDPNPIPPYTLSDLLQIATTYTLRVPWTFFTTLLRRWNPWSTYQPPPLREHLFRHVMTCLGNNLPLSTTNKSLDLHGSSILTSPRYTHLASNLYQPVRTPLSSGYFICRGLNPDPLPPSAADIFLLHFHGGGYVAGHPAAGAAAHIYLAERLREKGVRTVVFSVDYTLADGTEGRRWPRQVEEAGRAFEWVVGELGVRRERVVVVGDSAGGHLVLGLLVWLFLRRKGRRQGEEGDGKGEGEGREDDRPGAAVLLSPCVNLYSSHPRVLALHWEERLFKIGLDRYCEMLMRDVGNDLQDLYGNFAVEGEKRGSWAEILPRKTWVSAGAEELGFRFDIEDWVQMAREDGADVELQVEEGKNHAWQSAEAFGQQRRFLELPMGEDGGLMQGYRRVAEEIYRMVI